jgi:hypothetical protein
MANVFFGDYDNDFEDLSGKKKPKTKLGKALAKTKIGKAIAARAKKMTPAQKKRAAAIMAMPLPPLTKRLMIAKMIKGKPKTKAQKKRAAIAKTGLAVAAGGITGGIASLIARRLKKKKAAKEKKAKAARLKKAKAAALPAVSTAPVQSVDSSYNTPAARYATPEGIQDTDDTGEMVSQQERERPEPETETTEAKADKIKVLLPVLLGVGVLFFMMQKKKL